MLAAPAVKQPLPFCPPEPGPCPDCSGTLIRSQNDPRDPFLWCADCDWQGTDEYARAVEAEADCEED